MKESILLYLLLLSTSLWTAEIPNLTYPDNKLVDAWDDEIYSSDIDDFDDALNAEFALSPERMERIDFKATANWRPLQSEFAVRSINHLLKEGIDKNSGPFKKLMGVAGILTGYDYIVQPTYFNSLYTRIDRFAMAPVLDAHSTITRMDDYLSRVSFKPGYDLHYAFYRQFKDPKKAVLAKPYFHKNLPFDALHAEKGMKPSDVFHFKARLTILLDFSYLTDIAAASVGASAGAYASASGDFEVFVIKLNDKDVHVKLVASKQHRTGVKVSGVTLVDGIIAKVTGTNLLTAKLEKSFNSGTSIDYIIDLSKKDAALAFDQSMLQIRNFTYTSIALPKKQEDFRDKLIVNLVPFEKVRIESKEKHIKRVFNADNAATAVDKGVSLGTNFIGMNFNSHSSVNTMVNKNEDHQSYSLKSKEKSYDSSFLFGLYEKSSVQKTTSIFNLSAQEEKLMGVIATAEQTNNQFDQRDLRILKKKLERQFPQIFHELNFNSFEKELSQNAVGVKTFFTLSRPAIQQLPSLKKDQIKKLYLKYLSQFDINDLLMKAPRGHEKSKERSFQMRVNQISIKLENFLNKDLPMSERVQLYSKLLNENIFKATGSGFLLELLSHTNWKETVRIEIRMNSTAGAQTHYATGSKGPENLFSNLIYLEQLTHKTDFDLRMLFESLEFLELPQS